MTAGRTQASYTPAQRLEAQTLLAQGDSRDEVHDRLGIPKSTLSMWITKYDWEASSNRAVAYNDATRETVLRDIDRGVTISEVSRLTGISRKTIYRWLRSRGKGTGANAPSMRRCPCVEYGVMVPRGDRCPRCGS